MSISAGVSVKAKDAYPTGAPGPCSQLLVESELLINSTAKLKRKNNTLFREKEIN